MIRNIILLFVAAICGTKALSQTPATRFEKVINQTGVNLKVDSYFLPDFKLNGNTSGRAKILKVFVGRETHSFYQLEWGNFRSVISFSELLELQQALSLTREQSAESLNSAPDHTEGKYTTSDGFEIGFMRPKGKITWFISNKTSGSTLLLESTDMIDQQISLATERLKQTH